MIRSPEQISALNENERFRTSRSSSGWFKIGAQLNVARTKNTICQVFALGQNNAPVMIFADVFKALSELLVELEQNCWSNLVTHFERRI